MQRKRRSVQLRSFEDGFPLYGVGIQQPSISWDIRGRTKLIQGGQLMYYRPHTSKNILKNFVLFLASQSWMLRGPNDQALTKELQETLIGKFLDLPVQIFCWKCQGLRGGCPNCNYTGLVMSTHREEIQCKNGHMGEGRR